jgi:transposase InsO family protein
MSGGIGTTPVCDEANCNWIADFTYLWTADGSLYIAVFIDLFPGGLWAGR